jgi:hypothetical protein
MFTEVRVAGSTLRFSINDTEDEASHYCNLRKHGNHCMKRSHVRNFTNDELGKHDRKVVDPEDCSTSNWVRSLVCLRKVSVE